MTIFATAHSLSVERRRPRARRARGSALVLSATVALCAWLAASPSAVLALLSAAPLFLVGLLADGVVLRVRRP